MRSRLRPRHRSKSRLLLAVLCTLTPVTALEAQCLEYGTRDVELVGMVLRRVFPGRPNYENISRGDQPDTVWVLRLERSLCISASAVGPARRRISEVQIISDGTPPQLRTVLDRRVMFRGRLGVGETGRHHLPVIYMARVYIVELNPPMDRQARAAPPPMALYRKRLHDDSLAAPAARILLDTPAS